MKKKALLFLFLFCTCLGYSQTKSQLKLENSTDTLLNPNLWVRADKSIAGSSLWQDVSGQSHSLFPMSGSLPDTFSSLNFNPSFYIENDYFTAPEFIFQNQDITVMTVYKVYDTHSEQAIWSVVADTNQRVGLTTLNMLDSNYGISYVDSNEIITIVNTLFRQLKQNNGNLPGEFYLLKADSLPFSGDIAECLLFDFRINNITLTQYISYLAIKYGITLFETDYLDSRQRIIWDWKNNPDYSYSIGGIGKDSITGLEQKQSYLLDNKAVAGFNEIAKNNEKNNSELEEGVFLIWGFDSMKLNFTGTIFLEEDFSFNMYGNGLLQATTLKENQNIHPVAMHVDASQWEGNAQNYWLLIDRSGNGNFLTDSIVFYFPDSVDNNNILYFSNIQWDPDKNGNDRFCFTKINVDTLLNHSKNITLQNINACISNTNFLSGNDLLALLNHNNEVSGDGESQKNINETQSKSAIYKLYPNPSKGDFILDVHYPEITTVTVRIYTAEGKLIDVKSGYKSDHYKLEYNLFVSGVYFIEIEGGGYKKTLQISII